MSFVVPGRLSHRRRPRNVPARMALGVVALAWLTMLAGAGMVAPTQRALAAPANASATAYLPSASELPGAFREQATVDVGGLGEPDSNVRRIFVSTDGSQTLTVEVAVRGSPPDAEMVLDGRINQLVRYHGWLFGAIAGLGEHAFRGLAIGADGQQSQLLLFRVRSIAAEVGLAAPVADPAVVDRVARIVEAKIMSEPDAVLSVPGFSATPRSLPGKEPTMPPAIGAGGLGDASVGNTAGAPGTTDTTVLLTILGIERPWAGTSGPRPPRGFNYVTLDIAIEVAGPTAANVVLEDFFVVALDGRDYPAVIAREPAIRAAQAVTGSPVRGWLTFALPTDQQAQQLVWRLRSTVPLATQGGDSAMVVPLTVGATAAAGLGTPAPPNSTTVDPNNPVPPGSQPAGPQPSQPSQPSGPSSSPSSPSRPGRGGSGLQ